MARLKVRSLRGHLHSLYMQVFWFFPSQSEHRSFPTWITLKQAWNRSNTIILRHRRWSFHQFLHIIFSFAWLIKNIVSSKMISWSLKISQPVAKEREGSMKDRIKVYQAFEIQDESLCHRDRSVTTLTSLQRERLKRRTRGVHPSRGCISPACTL